MVIKIDEYGYCIDCESNHNCFCCDRMKYIKDKTINILTDNDKIKSCEECFTQFIGKGNLCNNCLRK